MSEHSPGENNIESLAERAKEMLERVRVHNDGPSSDATSHDAFLSLDDDVSDELADEVAVIVDEVEIQPVEEADEVEIDEDPIWAAEEVDLEDLSLIDHSETSAVGGYVESLAVPSSAMVVDEFSDVPLPADESEPNDTLETVMPDAHDDEDEDRALPLLVPAATSTSGVDHLFADESEENDPSGREDRRRFGGLLPLLLLALVVLAVLLFIAAFLGSDDDVPQTGPSLVDQPDEDGSSTDAPNTSESVVTTEAPSTTGTTATTAEPEPDPDTEPGIPETAWTLLGEETGTTQFAVLGGPLGLQEALEASIDENGDPIELTLFAPSDAAIQALTPAQLEALAIDPAAASALINYHIIDQRLTPELLFESAGSQIVTRSGLPIDVSLDGEDIVLNGTVRLSLAGLTAGNGAVHVIDSVLEPPTLNAVLDIGNIQFEVRSSVIAPAGEVELQKAFTFFEENPDVSALIEGHTDTDGPSEPNQRLSDRRANAVRDFLIAEGIDGSRLEAVGLGEADPILVSGVEDKVASRRIDFVVR